MKVSMRRRGFTIVEVVLSLSIIATFFSVIFIFINNMFFFINKNKDYSRFSEHSILIFSSIDPIVTKAEEVSLASLAYDTILPLDNKFLEGFSSFYIAEKEMPNNFEKKKCYSNFFVIHKEKNARET
jgi:prepilin-type N-terminal cleavage/methylation domain-containing protein